MNQTRKNRTVAQTITVICATCGEPVKINNRYEETPFRLYYGTELFFGCPNCNYIYDVPIKVEKDI